MSVNLPSLYVQQYANTIMMLSQQVDSRLSPFVMTGTGHVGKQVSPVDQYAKIEASENNERFASMPRTDAAVDRRWVFPRNWDINQMIDKNDLMRVLNDPKALYARAAVAAMNRKKDLILLQAMDGTNYTGETGSTSTSLGSGQVVGVNTGGTASSLNVAKIRNGLKILRQGDVDVDGEQITLVTNAKGYDNLFTEVQVTSKDYNQTRDGVPVMSNGRIQSFMGVQIVVTERVFSGTDDQSGTSDSSFMFCKSGVYLGTWSDINTDISERKDLRALPWQIYTNMTIGATRLEEAKVVRIWTR